MQTKPLLSAPVLSGLDLTLHFSMCVFASFSTVVKLSCDFYSLMDSDPPVIA